MMQNNAWRTGAPAELRSTVRLCTGMVAVTAILLLACSGDPAVGPDADPGAPAALQAVTASQLSGVVNQPLEPVPTVRVVDAAGRGVPGIEVTFAASAGEIAHAVAVTDNTGSTSPRRWQLGTRAGTQRLRATALGKSIWFVVDAAPQAPAQLEKVVRAPQPWIVFTGETAPSPSVRVLDDFRNPVAGALVTFSAAAWEDGSGRWEHQTRSDANGFAYAPGWVIGSAAGDYFASAQSGSAGASFHAIALDPDAVAWYELVATRPGEDPARADDDVIELRLALSSFDPCACHASVGRYIERGVRRTAAGTSSLDSFGSFHTSGAGANEWAVFIPHWGSGFDSWYWPASPARIEGTRLLIDRIDEQRDAGMTWVYEPIVPGHP